MNKINYILVVAIASVIMISCKGGPTLPPQVDFDHEAQAKIDKDSLISFLKNNFYNAAVDSIQPKSFDANATMLIDDNNLYSKEVTEKIEIKRLILRCIITKLEKEILNL